MVTEIKFLKGSPAKGSFGEFRIPGMALTPAV